VCEGNLDAHRTWSGGDVLDLGGIQTFVHGRRPGSTIRLKAEFTTDGAGIAWYVDGEVLDSGTSGAVLREKFGDFLVGRVHSAAVELEIAADGGGHLRAWRTWINSEPVGVVHFDRMRPQAEISEINWDHPVLLENTVDRRVAANERFRKMVANTCEDDSANVVEVPPQEGESEEPNLGALRDLYFAIGAKASCDSVIQIKLPRGILYPTDRPLPIVLQTTLADGAVDRPEAEAEQAFIDLLSQLLLGPLGALKKLLSDLRYVGPLRAMPPRESEPPNRHGSSRWPTGIQAWESLARSVGRTWSESGGTSDLIKQTSRWLESKELLDTGYRLEVDMYKRVPAAISTLMTAGDFAGFSETVADAIRREPERVRTVLRDVGRNIVLQPQDVGVGLSQIVPVLVALLDPGTDLVCLEQPELHLHPRQQASLGDALIKAIHDFPNRIMVVETHSEHLILRLLRRVRETTAAEAEPDTELRATQVAVAYVQPNSTNATVTSIALTDDGDFQQAWPNGFFAERAKELF
jgi:hypothetical protein